MIVIRRIFIVFSLLFCFYSNGQSNFSKSIVWEGSSAKNMYLSAIDSNIYNTLKKDKVRANYVLYHWEQNIHKVTLDDDFREEKPASQIVFMKSIGYFEMHPEIKILTDTSGNTTDIFFETYSKATLIGKVVDVATSKISRIFVYSFFGESRKQINIDWKKYFGSDPAKLKKNNSKEFAKAELKARNAYSDEIDKLYWSKVSESKNKCKWLNIYLTVGDDKYFEVIAQPDLIEKSVRDIEFNGTIQDGVLEGSDYDVLIKRNIEDQHYYEKITSVYVNEVGEQKSKAKVNALTKSKDLATELKNGSKLILVASDNHLLKNKLNTKDDVKKISVSFKKDCLFCAMDAERSIAESPVVDLVERNAPELKYFAELLKSAEFVDYSVESLQGKEIGSQLLITRDKKFINAIDVRSNKSLISLENTEKFLGMEYNVQKIGFNSLSQILSAFDQKLYGIAMVKVLEEKKEKVKKVLVHNPVGFDDYSKFDIVTLEKEDVDGEVFYRQNKVGEGRLGEQYSINLAEMKIKDGEKEIYSLLQKNTPIYFVYSK